MVSQAVDARDRASGRQGEEAAPAGAQHLRRRRGGGDCVDGRIRTVSSSSLLDRHRCWRGAPPPLHHHHQQQRRQRVVVSSFNCIGLLQQLAPSRDVRTDPSLTASLPRAARAFLHACSLSLDADDGVGGGRMGLADFCLDLRSAPHLDAPRRLPHAFKLAASSRCCSHAANSSCSALPASGLPCLLVVDSYSYVLLKL
jgi:hypothetical protein